MKTTAFQLVFFASVALSAPTKTFPERELSKWSPELAEFYSTVGLHVREARDSSSYPPSCGLSAAQMPQAPTPLPSPDPSISLMHVAIGRGVQNYTCANSSADAKPTSIGAVANLYNASSVASCYPDILSILPGLALQIPYPSAYLPPSKIDLSGFHYFATNTTPVFNLDNDPAQQLGVAVARKLANSTAPTTAIKGLNGSGNGAVVWLKLESTNATIGSLKNVYRLNTAGGGPPTTCLGMPPSFSVQYAAEYWFWGN